MQTITGLATARGFAIGPVFVYRGDGNVPIPEYVVDPGHEADELVRLKRAVMETKRDLVNLVETAAMQQKLIMSGYDPVEVLSEHLRRRADSIQDKVVVKKKGKGKR